MAKKRTHPHIHLPVGQWRIQDVYTPYGSPRGKKKDLTPPGGRPQHGAALSNAIRAAAQQAEVQRSSSPVEIQGAIPGVYLQFDSFPDLQLALTSMEKKLAKNARRHIELVAVTDRLVDDEGSKMRVQRAAVFVPEGELGHLLKQLAKYSQESPKQEGEKRNENVYDRIADVRKAALRALWTDDAEAYPSTDDEVIWWEVWLRRTDGEELSRLFEYATQSELAVGDRRIQFDDRTVTLLRASANDLATSLDVLGDIAELQRAKETAGFFVSECPADQAAWTADLTSRVAHAEADAPAVCVLDTGINAGHPLLEDALAPEDSHTCDPGWGSHDHHGHGTEMGGLALYGDLTPHLEGSTSVSLRHRLESVKILPPTGRNRPDLYGALTAQATSYPEISAPHRRRVFSLAVTARDTRDRGRPTSWSAAIDALAAGRVFDSSSKGLVYLDDAESAYQRLFVVSAGNIQGDALATDHLPRCDVEPIHDPAQAWNVLTIGAYTDKVVVNDPDWDGWVPTAERGELSPWSSTSTAFHADWPLKPDVVLEGGNVVHNTSGDVDFPCDDLCLLTTNFQPHDKLLVTSWATSAAAAQAARLCARIAAELVTAWPETIRGLVVHSARWTPKMREHFTAAKKKKSARAMLVRRYGFGVPSLERALRSASNAVTLVVQDAIRPFEDGKMREIHTYDLPWPRDVLTSLGGSTVRLRVTLSYFVEPNPGRRGWQTKYRYQSHGLRFEVKRPTESVDAFRRRLNKEALDEAEKRPKSEDNNDDWFLGPNARHRGSLHSDVLTGSAAELAERGCIAVYPVSGWWKDLKKRDRSQYGARYALVVSIETDDVDTDVWTPVATQVGVDLAVEV